MKDSVFKGVGTAIVTPFNGDGDINFERFEELIEFQIENDADAIVVCGTTGEASTLNVKEFTALTAFCIEKVNHRVPVIVGTGSNDTKKSIMLSKKAKRLKADAVLLCTPYYNKTNQEGLIRHFEAICNSVRLPAILYDVPVRTGMRIDIETYKRLQEIKNIVGVKEASGDVEYVAKILHACGDRFDIYSGNDGATVPYMSLGAKGVISVASNVIPSQMHDMCKQMRTGNLLRARMLQISFLDLINALFSDVNPIPVKAALNIIGFDVGAPRLPLCELSTDKKIMLQRILLGHGIIR